MKIRRIYLIAVLLPLLFSCGGKEDTHELPPPDILNPTNPDDQGGEDEISDESGANENPGTGETHEWDKNRGKVVTPSGTGWTSKSIDDGVVYYSFSGVDAISGKAQEVFAIDVDLSKSQYQIKLVYASPRVVCSEIHKQYNAVATMNANYELASIYIRVDGVTRQSITNANIGSTTVPNWKNDGGFACNGERGIQILDAGCFHHGDVTLAQQRKFYTSVTSEMPHVISSAPLLIYDYEPKGENFCDYTLTSAQVNKLNSEDPDRHQRVLHPRTAVALTENGHFIMFVVDGRTNFSSGMSARQLTKFLVKWFNPQYALNMDGGGSSTLCVKGEGDPETHVVNYPCDNLTSKDAHDHAGERARDVHFVLLKK